MKKYDKPSGIAIFVVVITILLFVPHFEDLNRVPGVNVGSGEVTVDVGDFHYHN